jgi:hypothetical protein
MTSAACDSWFDSLRRRSFDVANRGFAPIIERLHAKNSLTNSSESLQNRAFTRAREPIAANR